ncbi:MAG: GerMN domain-containing protein [Acidimicrobiales bacterium]
MPSTLAQVVYTLTEFSTVDAVEFWLEGAPVTVFSDGGLVLDGPVRVGRIDVLADLPPRKRTPPLPCDSAGAHGLPLRQCLRPRRQPGLRWPRLDKLACVDRLRGRRAGVRQVGTSSSGVRPAFNPPSLTAQVVGLRCGRQSDSRCVASNAARHLKGSEPQ